MSEPEHSPTDPPEINNVVYGNNSGHVLQTETIMGMVLAGPLIGATATILVTWLKNRRSDVTVEMTDTSGKKWNIQGTKLLDPKGYTQEIFDRIERASKVEIPEEGVILKNESSGESSQT
ncbi:effector-associated constant component EACC1 [Nocardiopsis alba]|uniref:effector-associated constant component EACC1 n=1 Tax=Nocardiopsis alba TaxID=53437 RepID=UPI0033BCDE06